MWFKTYQRCPFGRRQWFTSCYSSGHYLVLLRKLDEVASWNRRCGHLRRQLYPVVAETLSRRRCHTLNTFTITILFLIEQPP